MSFLENARTDHIRDCDVAVIGAGAVGVSVAYELLKAGRSVTVLERSDVCSGASYGNAGWVFPNHGAPLARPGAIRKALRWLSKTVVDRERAVSREQGAGADARAVPAAEPRRRVDDLRVVSVTVVVVYASLGSSMGETPWTAHWTPSPRRRN